MTGSVFGPGHRCLLGPQSAQRHSCEAVTEAERPLAGIQDDASLKSVSELVAQVAQAREVSRDDSGGCLDLDPCHLAAAELEHDIHLALLLVAIVKQRGRALCPIALTRQLHRGERLYDRARNGRALRRRLLKSWTIIRERDYIASPKDDGYRALHLIVRRAGLPIEVQVRTRGQDLWANAIEEAGRQTGVQFKFGEGPEMERVMLASVAALIAGSEEGKLSTAEVLTAGLLGAAIMKLLKRQEREAQ